MALSALLLSFAGASFSHVHSEDLDHSRVSGLIHQHEQGHHHDHEDGSTAPHADVELAPRSADDDAVYIAWAVTSPKGFTPILASEISGAPRIPLPVVASKLISETRFHVDDGPDVAPRQNKAPPAV